MVKLRKEQAGSTSLGHHWPEDGSVVEVPDHHAVDLLAIPDGDFTAVDDEDDDDTSAVDESPRPARRRRADRDDETAIAE